MASSRMTFTKPSIPLGDSKVCILCGSVFYRNRYRVRQIEWDSRKYCSTECSIKVTSKKWMKGFKWPHRDSL